MEKYQKMIYIKEGKALINLYLEIYKKLKKKI